MWGKSRILDWFYEMPGLGFRFCQPPIDSWNLRHYLVVSVKLRKSRTQSGLLLNKIADSGCGVATRPGE